MPPTRRVRGAKQPGLGKPASQASQRSTRVTKNNDSLSSKEQQAEISSLSSAVAELKQENSGSIVSQCLNPLSLVVSLPSYSCLGTFQTARTYTYKCPVNTEISSGNKLEKSLPPSHLLHAIDTLTPLC